MQIERRVLVQSHRLPEDQPPKSSQPVCPVHFALLQKGHDIVRVDFHHLDVHGCKIDGPERHPQIMVVGQDRTAQGDIDGRRNNLLLEMLLDFIAEKLVVVTAQ